MSTDAQVAEQWEEFVKDRYDPNKTKEDFRNYEKATPGVREFYRENHVKQTVDFVTAKKKDYMVLDKKRMGIWEAVAFLDTLVDDSDPDTDLTQVAHALQSAEAARKDGKPDWFVLTTFVHDLGKILCSYGEPQWAVVGDTFPVGCAFSDRIVFPQFFAGNPDSRDPRYNTENGMYEPGCGLKNVHMSFGHDEYLYHVTKDYLPEPAQYMIRYHSFYPWHREGAYEHLLDAKDREMLPWVKEFNPYDLYSKSDSAPDIDQLRPYYTDLINKYFPEKLNW
ncbi:MAG: inositol oxygenase [Acidobacteria bacterium]|nr:inositol oxygenase [Acidobacteriota bacterium]